MKYLIIVGIGIVILIGLFTWWKLAQAPSVVVTNFEECAATGVPVMESYPRQCRYGDHTFVEEIK